MTSSVHDVHPMEPAVSLLVPSGLLLRLGSGCAAIQVAQSGVTVGRSESNAGESLAVTVLA